MTGDAQGRTASCYGGDVSRKRELLRRRRPARRRFASFEVEIPEEAFSAALKMDIDGEGLYAVLNASRSAGLKRAPNYFDVHNQRLRLAADVPFRHHESLRRERTLISSIQIKNFRSIENILIPVTDLTVFVGQNDAGKSNVLRALNLFFNNEIDIGVPLDFVSDFYQFAKTGQRKAREIGITLSIKIPYNYTREQMPEEVSWTKTWREGSNLPFFQNKSYSDGQAFLARSRIPILLDRFSFTYVPAIKDKAFFADLQGRLYDVLSSVAADPLRKSADVFEQQLQVQLKQLLESISKVFEGSSSMRLPDNLRQIFENLEISGSGGIPLSRRGDGIKIRHIPMILRFISDKQDEILNKGGVRYSHIWGFEEPENNVEMVSCFKMANDLVEIINGTNNHQLLLTTHSPVFYRIDQLPCRSPTNTIFVEKKENHTSVEIKETTAVDETMGLMPIVAPFVAELKAKHDDLQKQIIRVREIAEKRKPTLFVEGPTDVIILKKCIAVFYPEKQDYCLISSGHDGEYGSAAAVSSRALAWALEMKHRPSQNRIKAVALFDQDDAGDEARKELGDAIRKLNLKTEGILKIIPLPTSPFIIDLRKAGFQISNSLESYYTNEFWEFADKRSWLEESENLGRLLSAKQVNEMAHSGVTPFDKQSDVSRRRLMKSFKKDTKITAAKHLEKLPAKEARSSLALFERLLEVIFKELR